MASMGDSCCSHGRKKPAHGRWKEREEWLSDVLQAWMQPSLKYFFFFFAALDLHCCMWAFSSCGEYGLLIAVASVVENAL